MIYLVKVFVGKHDYLSLFYKIYGIEEKKRFFKVVIWLCMLLYIFLNIEIWI